MTITVTIDEIRAYQERCQKWTTDRAAIIEHQLREQFKAALHDFHTRAPFENEKRIKAAVAEWDKTHPMPTIVPTV